MEMEGQGQPGGGEESEFRELLGQMQEIITELGELEERWRRLNSEIRRAQTDEIEERIMQVIERWQRFPDRAALLMHAELEWKMRELCERCQRFPDQFPLFRWSQQLAHRLLLLPVAYRLLLQPRRNNPYRINPQGHFNNPVCIICRHEILLGEQARDLRCGHRYHVTCIFNPAQIEPVCPVCPRDIYPAP
jgi:hypothetical protein